MANLRGGQKLWDAATVADGEASLPAVIGPGPYVAVFVSNEDASVDDVAFDVEVAVSDSVEPGRNALGDFSEDPDCGLTWFKYHSKDGTAINGVLAHGTNLMFDLSPFGPQFIRVRRTDAGADAVLSAWVSAFGG